MIVCGLNSFSSVTNASVSTNPATLLGFGTWTAFGAGRAAFVAMTYNRMDGKIYVLDCLDMAEPTPQKIRQAIEEFVQKYKPQELRVEINAHQKAYGQSNTEPLEQAARLGADVLVTAFKHLISHVQSVQQRCFSVGHVTPPSVSCTRRLQTP